MVVFSAFLATVQLAPTARADKPPQLTVVLDKQQVTNPFGLDFDKQGNAYLVEYLGGRVLKYSRDGRLSVLSGAKMNGFVDNVDARQAVYNGLHNIVRAGNGDLYLSDTRNNRIRKIDAKTGRVSTICGGAKGFAGDDGPARQAQLADPISISLSSDHRRLLIADIQNRRVREIDLAQGVIRTVAGNGKRGAPEDGQPAREQPLTDPRACDRDADGNLYILERGGNALRVVRPDGRIFTVAGDGKKGHRDGPAKKARFAGPKHLCFDRDGSVLIADDLNHAIRRYDPRSGQVSTVLGGEVEPRVQLQRPHGVRVDPAGRLWVCDSWNDRVLRLDPPPSEQSPSKP